MTCPHPAEGSQAQTPWQTVCGMPSVATGPNAEASSLQFCSAAAATVSAVHCTSNNAQKWRADGTNLLMHAKEAAGVTNEQNLHACVQF